ncbi:MAG: FAD-dependent urate hydroxylase HpxO [Leptolyngbyaceae bacterium]|nr:FAD-dependent urate hydroxylase HpxO [Leptolyngbyaceae bacterium]
MNHLKAIIVGAGMGGLTTAIAMKQAGYDVEIYDKVGELRPAGAGISLWSNGVKVLNRLGLGDEIAKIGGPMERMAYIHKNGTVLTDFSLTPLVEQVGQCPYPVARTDLQGMLLRVFGPENVQLNAKCVAVEQTADAVTAIFEDGHRATGDILVGADGTHSIIRATVLGEQRQRRYAGYVNWNGLVPADERIAPKNSWVIYVGDGQRASVMPVGGDRFYFFFDVPLPHGLEAKGDARVELAHYFAGWADPVQQLIQALDPATTNRVPIHDIEPLPTFVNGRIALLGDAGHSTAPDLGQGGCQAMEDAWTLATLLLTNNISVADALKRYDRARCDRTGNLVLKARKRADMIHGKVPEKTEAWYRNLANEDGSNIMKAIAEVILEGPLG